MSSKSHKTRVLRPFQLSNKLQVASLFDDFQDYLASLDPLDRLCRPEGYGEKYTDKMIVETSKEGIFMVAE